MGKIQLVIEIEERLYKNIIDNDKDDEEFEAMDMAFCNAKPLPKGHGDLIDRSTLEPDTEWSEWDDDWVSYSYGQIADADVVIKADGGGEDEVSD